MKTTEAGRRLYDFDLPYIFSFLLERPNIVGLDFCYNHLTCFGVRFLADFLSWDHRILRLNLMNNDIEVMDSYIVDAFGENKTLKSLRLNGNPFGKKGGEYVSFLLMFKDLEFLDIGQTDQTIQSLAWILGALVHNSSLKVLDLSRILGHPGYVNDSLHYGLAFSDILRLNRSLVELHISKNNITDTDLEQILFGLSFNRTLELLDLSSNSIGDYGAELMSEALLRGAPLKALMLSGNHIGNMGARALSFKLPGSQIKMLDLSYNRVRDSGIIDIVSTVRKPFPLLALFIFGNPFTGEALKMIDRYLLEGSLENCALDIVLHDYNGIIGHGRNTSVNRYKSRYYCLLERSSEEGKRKRNEKLAFCEPGCAAYKFHNVFNVKAPKTILPSIPRRSFSPA
ncbi:hypothetical protein GE061_005374 [Apolygus lucorum]|uniref:Leucine-rich repeat-containing protein 34 n=1 Tax=Apolygus lucorum TaxID=248454 RepID=A0A8S9WW37_APOLU|nr:hypothetical protein GE061_005374 [Apolygus lucorum]